jgi:hypothetical protein
MSRHGFPVPRPIYRAAFRRVPILILDKEFRPDSGIGYTKVIVLKDRWPYGLNPGSRRN